MRTERSLLACRSLTVAAGQRVLVSGLELALDSGEVTCLLGCNGAGKTTTLHALAGLHPPRGGEVLLDGRPLAAHSRRAIARRLGLLMQASEDPFPATVLDMALIGRHPHIGFWQWESEDDRAIARAALAATGLETLEQRSLETLSGGERRRLAIATVLAQQPAVYLLDEPVNHLDPRHQVQVLRHLRKLADDGCTVLMSLHDVNLAARHADRVVMLFGDGSWTAGTVAETFTSDALTRLYATPMARVPGGEAAFFYPS